MHACRYENEEKFPYNDGVMLWNMPYMRKTNAAFVAWILNQTNGLYFVGGWPNHPAFSKPKQDAGPNS